MTQSDTTMRERVAKSLCAVWDAEMNAEFARSNSFEYEPGSWEEWLPQADAAIAAMSAPAEPVEGADYEALIAAGFDDYSARCALRTEGDGGFCHAYLYSDKQWRFQTGGNDLHLSDGSILKCVLTKRLYAHPTAEPITEEWPPAHGLPDASRYKRALDLKWGETPFDDLTRGELLRLVQAYHAAALSADSVLKQFDSGGPFWTKGVGWQAKARLRFLISRAGDGGGNSRSTSIYRSFFRYAYGLLFPGLDPHDNWGIEEGGNAMLGRWKEGDESPILPGVKMRAIEWRDLLPKASD